MTEDEINILAHDVTSCLCGAVIEEIDGGNGHRYWAHVKRGRIHFDHAAIPQLPQAGSGSMEFTTAELNTIAGGMSDDEHEFHDAASEAIYIRVTEEIDRRNEK